MVSGNDCLAADGVGKAKPNVPRGAINAMRGYRDEGPDLACLVRVDAHNLPIVNNRHPNQLKPRVLQSVDADRELSRLELLVGDADRIAIADGAIR